QHPHRLARRHKDKAFARPASAAAHSRRRCGNCAREDRHERRRECNRLSCTSSIETELGGSINRNFTRPDFLVKTAFGGRLSPTYRAAWIVDGCARGGARSASTVGTQSRNRQRA